MTSHSDKKILSCISPNFTYESFDPASQKENNNEFSICQLLKIKEDVLEIFRNQSVPNIILDNLKNYNEKKFWGDYKQDTHKVIDITENIDDDCNEFNVKTITHFSHYDYKSYRKPDPIIIDGGFYNPVNHKL